MRAAPEVSYAMESRLRVRAYRAAENIRHSLRNGFTAYNELSPVNGSFATVAPRKRLLLRNVTPAPRRQDHTSSPYASMPIVFDTSTSTASHRTFETIASAPLVGRDRQIMPQFGFREKRNIFLFGD